MMSILTPINWLIDHTLGYLYDLLCWLLNLILPNTFTLIITDYKDMFYNGIKYTLSISLVGTLIGFFIACFLGMIRSIKVNENDSLIKKIIKKVSNFSRKT